MSNKSCGTTGAGLKLPRNEIHFINWKMFSLHAILSIQLNVFAGLAMKFPKKHSSMGFFVSIHEFSVFIAELPDDSVIATFLALELLTTF